MNYKLALKVLNQIEVDLAHTLARVDNLPDTEEWKEAKTRLTEEVNEKLGCVNILKAHYQEVLRKAGV